MKKGKSKKIKDSSKDLPKIDSLIIPTVKRGVNRLKKPVIIIGSIILAILFIVLVVKFGIYLGYLTGEDIVIKLEQSHTSIILDEGEKEDVRYTVTANKNPLCSSVCETKFEDLSHDTIIAEDEFSLGTILPHAKSFSIKAQKKQGIDLYRFSVECRNTDSFLCYSFGEPSRREVLLFAETNLKNSTKSEISEKQTSLTTMINTTNIMYGTLKNYSLVFNENNLQLTKDVEKMKSDLDSLERLWINQEFDSFLKMSTEFESEFKKVSKEYDVYIKSLSKSIDEYNQKIDLITLYSLSAENLTKINLLQSNHEIPAVDINMSLEQLNERYSNLEDLKSLLLQESLKNSLQISLSHDLFYDVMCESNSSCIDHPNLNVRASQMPQDISIVCAQNIDTSQINNTELFLEKRSKKISEYKTSLPANLTYSDIIKEILDAGYGNETVLSCNLKTVNFLSPQIPQKIIFNTYNSDFLSADFSEIVPMCCIRNDCSACCVTCGNQNLPILFLHGHAFSNELSAEYSFDAFNSIINGLDKNLFIAGGVVYSYRDLKIDFVPNASFMVRGSYYFDLYSKKDASVLIPAKGESIDTYAIRLKELVNIVKQKTGKDKVIIVTHSMGGLVSRRYMQLFGSENVEKLVMIGTPNNGLDEQTASLCNTLYTTLACRDMKKDSSFMNELNSGKLPDIPIVNIIGRGCETAGVDGDGAVPVNDSFIEGAENYYINGTCSSTSKLHTELLNTKSYPKTLEILKTALGSN